jgi:biopolymer transport protein ExbD
MFSNGRSRRRKEVRFEIIPMIDVMMILVLFLAVMAFLPSVQSSIQTNLPGSGAQDAVSMEDVMITLNDSATVFVNGRTVTAGTLIAEVQREIQGNPQRRVVIAADKNLPYEQVVNILGLLRKASIRNVALATEAASP